MHQNTIVDGQDNPPVNVIPYSGFSLCIGTFRNGDGSNGTCKASMNLGRQEILFEQRNAQKDTKKFMEKALSARISRICHGIFSCPLVLNFRHTKTNMNSAAVSLALFQRHYAICSVLRKPCGLPE